MGQLLDETAGSRHSLGQDYVTGTALASGVYGLAGEAGQMLRRKPVLDAAVSG